MTKPLYLIYGEDTKAMKELASQIRDSNKTVEVNLRSADAFTISQIEEAAKVYLLGDYPHIANAYEGKAPVDGVRRKAVTGTEKSPEELAAEAAAKAQAEAEAAKKKEEAAAAKASAKAEKDRQKAEAAAAKKAAGK